MSRPAPVRDQNRPLPPHLPKPYGEGERWLSGLTNFERTRLTRERSDEFKLDRFRAMLAVLDHPERLFRSVHVAGSKGKGSVVEMLSSMLGAGGYAVGVYTSPHLVRLNERVRVGAYEISSPALNELLRRIRRVAGEVQREHGEPTFFEAITAAAFVYFAEQAVDLAVLETGLGGRLDCTNVVMPEVVGLTAIQLEHTEILGDTLEKIAFEKAGIMKPGVEALSVEQPDEVIEVFRAVAAERGAELSVLGRDLDYSRRFEATHDQGPHARVGLSGRHTNYEHISVPIEGEHQSANCALALALLDRLQDKGFKVGERELADGLARTPRNGRLEFIYDRPRLIIDGAHTPESVAAAMRAIGAQVPYDSMVVIFGCGADKQVDRMLEELDRGADKVIFTRASDNPRAMDAEVLCAMFDDRHGKMAQVEPDLKSAINTAARAVGAADIVLIAGSFYLAGEAKALLEAKRKRDGA